MNKAITAMMVKLNWQQDELLVHLQGVEAERVNLTELIKATQLRINQPHPASNQINPDFEINRLNFITLQYLQQEGLELRLKECSEQKIRLNEQLLRVKTELKMLEQYTEREHRKLINERQKKEELAMDEWALRPRSSR